MSDIAIRVENISKQYRIGMAKYSYYTLRDHLVDSMNSILRRKKSSQSSKDMIWALKDISFEVKRGEVVGIIGRNGAGKSTFLKILSRITEPTIGRAELYGRVGSLLEVGTGFHPELTGRDNIYLNGAILGMKKTEIEQRFDEIVSFAELERFIDTPVKRYSSGMYVRLAFSVAAHLQSDILIVDEVLAVGDLPFQNKCLGKMDSVARGGRTVLCVTHNLGTIEKLCGRAILLEEGSVIAEGRPSEVINRYLERQFPERRSATSLLDHPGRRTGSEVILREARVYVNGRKSTIFRTGDSLKIAVSFKRGEPIFQMHFGIIVESATGQRITSFPSSVQSPHFVPERVHEGTIICEVPCLHLLPGLYYLTFLIKSLQTAGPSDNLDRINQAIQFSVEAGDAFGPIDSSRGVFLEEAKWFFEGT
jgi:lipopolysaccharide transport system ATP-binding protein